MPRLSCRGGLVGPEEQNLTRALSFSALLACVGCRTATQHPSGPTRSLRTSCTHWYCAGKGSLAGTTPTA